MELLLALTVIEKWNEVDIETHYAILFYMISL